MAGLQKIGITVHIIAATLMFIPIAVTLIIGLIGVVKVPRRLSYEFGQLYLGAVVTSALISAIGLGICAMIDSTFTFGYVFAAVCYGIAGIGLFIFRHKLS